MIILLPKSVEKLEFSAAWKIPAVEVLVNALILGNMGAFYDNSTPGFWLSSKCNFLTDFGIYAMIWRGLNSIPFYIQI